MKRDLASIDRSLICCAQNPLPKQSSRGWDSRPTEENEHRLVDEKRCSILQRAWDWKPFSDLRLLLPRLFRKADMLTSIRIICFVCMKSQDPKFFGIRSS